MRALDLTNQTFNRLTVIQEAEKQGEKRRWECQCACGRKVIVAQISLRSGHTKSCGCQRFKENSLRSGFLVPHDQREYWVWAAMVARCHNPKCKAFHNYGARGISV